MKFPHGKSVNLSLAIAHRNDSDPLNSAAHMIAGVFLLLGGVSMVYCSARRFYLCEREARAGLKRPRKYESSLIFPIWPSSQIPIESYLGLGASCSGFVGKNLPILLV